MNNIFLTILITSFALIQPLIATSTLSLLQSNEISEQVWSEILCPSGNFKMKEARATIERIKKDVMDLYGVDVNINLVIENSLKTMRQMGIYTENEMETARVFYAKLFASNTPFFTALSIFGQKNNSQELILPDKMAGGFMLVLGGSLLCVLPFGFTQGLGASLIVTGTAIIVEGSASGEKPYYLDKETGQKSPVEPSNQGSNIRFGTQF